MNKKLAVLPVDARPVTRDLPIQLAKIAGWEVLSPEKEKLGFLKEEADTSFIHKWLWEQASQVDGFVLSIDMLLYGGLVPSRINTESEHILKDRLAIILEMKKAFPDLRIYAFSSTMRISNNYVNEEEKDYWRDVGEEIWALSYHSHRFEKRNEAGDQEKAEELKKKIDVITLDDYLATRARNFRINQSLVDLVKEAYIDHLVFPQDDTSEYGWNIKEKELLEKVIHKNQLFDQVSVYPGADEVATSLTTRIIFNVENIRPPYFYPMYSGEKGALSTALYEDRPLIESVKSQLAIIGSHTVETPQEAEIVLGVNVPGRQQGDLALEKYLEEVRTSDRNIYEWLMRLSYYQETGKKVAIADTAYANGADSSLVPLLLMKLNWQELFGYAGWNTASNTIGTVVSHAALRSLGEKRQGFSREHHDLQMLTRFLDDYLYQAEIRRDVRSEIEGKTLAREELLAVVKSKFLPAAQVFLDGIASNHQVAELYLPWARTFEIGVKVRKKETGGVSLFRDREPIDNERR